MSDVLRAGTPEEAGVNAARVEVLRKRMPSLVDDSRMRTATLVAARRGVIFYQDALGPLTDLEGSPPVQLNSISRVASVTKPVTAALALMLLEDGLLALNRPLKEYLPEVRGAGTDAVEVQHLFTHTSGFKDEVIEPVYQKALEAKGVPPAEIYFDADLYFQSTWEVPSSLPPGTEMSYSDHNYNLLGLIVQRVSGEPLEVFAKHRLFEPLGMNSSTMCYDETKKGRIFVRDSTLVPKRGVFGAHSLYTSATDISAFCQMILQRGVYGGKRVLSPASVREMMRNQIPGIGTEIMGSHDEASWSLGWSIQGDERWMWAEGTLPPVGTLQHLGAGGHNVWIDPVNEVVGVYLSVCFEINEQTGEHHANFDTYMNMVTACCE